MSIREALETLYTDKCTVMHTETYEENGITKYTKKVVYKDIPCRLSFGKTESGSPTVSQDIYPRTNQNVALFISPDVDIPSGSEIEITRNGITRLYHMSSEPKIYPSHCEIFLELKEYFS